MQFLFTIRWMCLQALGFTFPYINSFAYEKKRSSALLFSISEKKLLMFILKQFLSSKRQPLKMLLGEWKSKSALAFWDRCTRQCSHFVTSRIVDSCRFQNRKRTQINEKQILTKTWSAEQKACQSLLNHTRKLRIKHHLRKKNKCL